MKKLTIFGGVIVSLFLLLYACKKTTTAGATTETANAKGAMMAASPAALSLASGPFVTAYVEVNSNNFVNPGCYTYGAPANQLFGISVIFAANINSTNGVPTLYFNPQVQDVLNSGKVAYLQSLGIKVLLDVLGNHQNAGWGCFTTYAAADAFAVQCANAVQQYGLDGIDIDDEYSTCTANNSSLVLAAAALRARLGTSKIISMAAFGQSNYFTATYNGQKLGDILDYVFEQTYFSSDYAGRLQPYINAGVPKSKLGLGTDLSNSDQAAVATYVKNNGLASAMVYNVANNSQTKLSSISNVLYGSATAVKPNCIDGTGTPPVTAANMSLVFDGTNEYLNSNTFNLAGTSLTYEGWIKPAAFKSVFPNISTIMGIEVSDANVALLRLGDASLANNKLQFVLNTGGATPKKLSSVSALNANTWYHVAATYDGATMKIYINGVLDASLSATGTISANGAFQVSRSWDANRGFNGQFDELRVWKTALSQTSIQANKCSVAANSTSLEAYWKFNEGTGTSIADATGHGHNANLVNMESTDWSTIVPCP
ncbi:LamG-like jellyroll fold domain-containing protein [Pedobacter punctiformis]|uniref:Glycosyl hydrolase family 18 protein n=1 Tax=Pedobacter punctiformis TaxID=3004097 RepID=A0ABT4LC04_9SPHI|nr:LamG-like jellyroll fold domain-containing protein [Pedobacter sp. HCMS5-2]MCZ4245458.1 glycosyl hydrolase family 18 protein [Pedobacter sp. HCMS5-2]